MKKYFIEVNFSKNWGNNLHSIISINLHKKKLTNKCWIRKNKSHVLWLSPGNWWSRYEKAFLQLTVVIVEDNLYNKQSQCLQQGISHTSISHLQSTSICNITRKNSKPNVRTGQNVLLKNYFCALRLRNGQAAGDFFCFCNQCAAKILFLKENLIARFWK